MIRIVGSVVFKPFLINQGEVFESVHLQPKALRTNLWMLLTLAPKRYCVGELAPATKKPYAAT